MLVALQNIAKKYNLQIGTFGHAGMVTCTQPS
ncbi:hypothetical protein N752_18575 [Desulforamulus aquiferis]|nr:hypothetical protein N752_18575 [Desulforamulus aquiferis]